MGLMNAIGLQPRNPTTSVTSQGTQTLALQLQNAETQTEREIQEPGTAASGPGEGESHRVMLVGKYGWGGEEDGRDHHQGSWLLHVDLGTERMHPSQDEYPSLFGECPRWHYQPP